MKLTLTDESQAILRDHPEFTAKWISGLRSGKYTQQKFQMCDPGAPNSACCLHVMEIECDGKKWEEGYTFGLDGLPLAYEVPCCLVDPLTLTGGFLPEDLSAMHEDEDIYHGIFKPQDWNDDLGLTFDQISDLLEHGTVEYEVQA